jgi:predicted nucleic acid-binding protein
MICVDANVLIAALDATDRFHHVASETIIEHAPVVALNVTWAEALVRPIQDGNGDVALGLLAEYGIEAVPVHDDVAFRAAEVRGRHGTRNLPMLDALVVAYGLVHGMEVVTADAKWPTIPDAIVRVLEA